MKRFKAIAIVVLIIIMEMMIYSTMTVFTGTIPSGEVLTKEGLLRNVVFLLIYNPSFLLFTYIRRNSSAKGKENYQKIKKVFQDIF